MKRFKHDRLLGTLALIFTVAISAFYDDLYLPGEPHLGAEDDTSKNFTSHLDIAGNVDIFKNENELPDSKDLKPCPLIPPGRLSQFKSNLRVSSLNFIASSTRTY